MPTAVEIFEQKCAQLKQWVMRPAVVTLAVCIVAIALQLNARGADPDLFARVAMGKLVVNSGAVPIIDPFAFTPKKPIWVDHEWLSGFVFYSILDPGGDRGLFLFKLICVAFSFMILVRASRVTAAHATSSLFWLLIAAVQCKYLWASTIRSQVFTYLFLPYLLWALAEYWVQRRKLKLAALPFIFVFWANAHGGFVSGLGLFGVFIFADFLEQRKIPWAPIVSFLFSLLATCINPYGAAEYWSYILHAVTMPRPSIDEWARMPVTSAQAIVSNFIVVSFVIGLWRGKNSKAFVSFLLMLMSAFYAYRHERLVGILLMVSVVFGMEQLQLAVDFYRDIMGRWYRQLTLVAPAMLGVLIPVLALITARVVMQRPGLDASGYPVGATAWLWQNGQGGRLLVDFNRGSFALWRLYPRYQISVDGRYEELYTEETVQSVSRAFSPKHPEDLHAVNPDYVLMDQSGSGKFIEAYAGLGWREVYRDNVYSVLSKNPNDTPAEIRLAKEEIWIPRF